MEEPLILGRYRPLATLGTGGHGEVVLAYDTRMARRVAVKRLRLPTDARGIPLRDEGLGEARTAALLNHPAIVTVHDWDTDADEAFIIMEDVEGASLAEVLDDRGGPLGLDEAAAVVDAVAGALSFAHENGVLHLDVKPENVLVDRRGQVKVTDFGVAALSGPGRRATALGGTLGYMPPEQLAGGPVDERTDQWAFAALVYESLTGANPFASDSVEGAVFRSEMVEPSPPGDLEPSLPPALDDILLAALAPHPADRYPTVEAFAERVMPLLGRPAEGRFLLAEAVAGIAPEEAEDEDAVSLGLWDRLLPRSAALHRLAAAAVAAWLVWAGLRPFFPAVPAGAGAALAAAAGALAPALGIALGLASIAASALALSWWAGAAVLLSVAAYWWLGVRTSGAEGLVPIVSPVLGVAGGALFAPVLLGFFLRPLRAAAYAGVSAAAVVLAAAAAGTRAPYLDVPAGFLAHPLGGATAAPDALRALVSGPGALAAVAGWAGAAAVMSLACRRASRGAALAGSAAASGVLYAAYAAWSFSAPAIAYPDETVLRQSGLSLILGVLLAAAGPPIRAEEE